MYEIKLKVNNMEYPLNDLPKGSVKQGINTIDSFSFTILPNNNGFYLIRDFKTLISVYNTKRKKYEFQGRVLYSSDSMDNKGKISKSVVCESFLGYLQDSRQDYIEPRNWTPTELITHLLTCHNSQTEEEKHFKVGTVFSDENIYIGIQRESTWDCIKKKIIEKIGGEIQLRVENDGMYIDIVKERGSTKLTSIELTKNMLSITKESNPSSYITRLIPLGAKINNTEERIDITSVNDGKKYIDDVAAIENFGLHIEYKTWDDVHEPAILKTKATNFLTENNKILQKFKISSLDLALIGIDIDFIDVCNYYPIKNKLLNIDETLRVITKTIDIVNKSTTTVEIGDNFKTLSDLEIERENQLIESTSTIKKLEADYQINIPKMKEEIADLKTRKSVASTTIKYYLSSSSTELIGGEWVDNPPEWVDGKYYWQKIITTFSDNTTSESKPVCITGGTGATGQSGTNGKDGATGNGIKSITTQFYLSTSKTSQAGGSWSTSMPTWSSGKYLWTRNLITYTDGTTSYSTPICDSSWEAVNDIKIGGRNYALGTRNAVVITGSNINNQCPNLYQLSTNWQNFIGKKVTISFDYEFSEGSSRTDSETNIAGQVGMTTTPWNRWVQIPNPSKSMSGHLSGTAIVPESMGSSTWIGARFDYFEGTITISNLKFEIGNKESDWSLAPEDIESDYTNLTNEAIKEIKSNISQTETKILSEVSEKYYTKGYTDDLISSISTSFEQTKDSFQMTFTELTKMITNVDGTVNSNYAELVKYIRFNDGKITLGEIDNPLILTLDNDRMSFLQNGIEVAYISDNKLYIYDGEFLNSLKIGRWVFVPRSNGNLSFIYV